MLDNTFAVFNILIIYSSQPQEDRRRWYLVAYWSSE
jgi:hypothetical protein